MTVFYRAMEIQGGDNAGKYHYCSSSGSMGPHSIGYCSPWETCPECEGRSAPSGGAYPLTCDRCNNNGIVIKENPCPGHDTEQEAREHYLEYVLDTRTRYDVREAQTFKPCMECGGLTENRARHMDIPTIDMPLCEKHADKEHVKKYRTER